MARPNRTAEHRDPCERRAAFKSSSLPRTVLCLLSAAILANGCASDDANLRAGLRKATPPFLLTEKERAERNLKDSKTLNLAYGRFQEQVGQPAEARKSYELVVRDDPKSVDAILGIARLDQLADKSKEAEAGFQKALRLKPGDPTIMAATGQFYATQKRWNDSIEMLTAAMKASPKEPIYKHELGVVKVQSGDIEGGLAIFKEMIGPEKAHYNVAYLLKQDGKTTEAAQQCRLALAANPQFDAAQSLLDDLQPVRVAGDSRPAKRGRAAAPHAGPRTTPDQGANVPAQTPVQGTVHQTSWRPPAPSVRGSVQSASAQSPPSDETTTASFSN